VYVLQIFETAPEFADVTNTRVLSSSKALMQKPAMSLSASQTSCTGSSSGGNLPASTSASAAPAASAAGALRTIRQSSYAQSYLTAANANQSNSSSNPVVMRSAVSKSIAGLPVYANVAVSSDPVVTTSSRGRLVSGMRTSLLNVFSSSFCAVVRASVIPI